MLSGNRCVSTEVKRDGELLGRGVQPNTNQMHDETATSSVTDNGKSPELAGHQQLKLAKHLTPVAVPLMRKRPGPAVWAQPRTSR